MKDIVGCLKSLVKGSLGLPYKNGHQGSLKVTTRGFGLGGLWVSTAFAGLLLFWPLMSSNCERLSYDCCNIVKVGSVCLL